MSNIDFTILDKISHMYVGNANVANKPISPKRPSALSIKVYYLRYLVFSYNLGKIPGLLLMDQYIKWD